MYNFLKITVLPKALYFGVLTLTELKPNYLGTINP